MESTIATVGWTYESGTSGLRYRVASICQSYVEAQPVGLDNRDLDDGWVRFNRVWFEKAMAPVC